MAGGDELDLVLIRHGRTAWNADRRFLGTADVPLDEVGRDEARALAARLAGRFDAVYSSPLSRARDTAAGLAPPEPVVIPTLHELRQGELEGLAFPEAFARFPDFFARWASEPGPTRVPGGETMEEARDRGLRALEEIARGHAPGARVAVVSHQIVISSVLCTLAGDPLTAWRSWQLPNTGVAALSWDGARFRVVAGGPHGGGV